MYRYVSEMGCTERLTDDSEKWNSIFLKQKKSMRNDAEESSDYVTRIKIIFLALNNSRD